MELQDFLSRNNISREEWDAAAIDWGDLKKYILISRGDAVN